MKDVSEDNRCPNCGAAGLEVGSFCPYCNTFRASEERFISIGENGYPTVGKSFDEMQLRKIIEEEDILLREENINLKKKQQNIIAILILIVVVQIVWLFLR